MSHAAEPMFFALRQSEELGQRIATQFGLALSPHEEREFPDGEHKIRPLVDVFERRIYVLHSLYSDARQSVNDKLCRLLFFIGALRDGGAAHITAIVPHLAYARKDKRSKAHDPVTTRYVASLFSAVEADAVLTLSVHNPAAEENAFRCRYFNLESVALFADYFAARVAGPLTVLAPDTGAVKNAQTFSDELEARGMDTALAFMTKVRSQDVVRSSAVFGSVRGRTVIVYDDLISSGTTIANAVEECAKEAAAIFVAATHGSFTAGAERLARLKAIRELVISDSVSSDRIEPEAWGGRLKVLESSTVFADFIRRSYPGSLKSARG